MSMQPGGLLPPLDSPGAGNMNFGRVVAMAGVFSLILFAMQIWGPKPTPAPTPTPTTTSSATPIPATAEAAPANPDLPATPAAPARKVMVAQDVQNSTTRQTIQGGFAATLSTEGGAFDQYVLTGYEDPFWTKQSGAPTKVDLARAQHDGLKLMSLTNYGGDVDLTTNASYELTEETPNRVVFERMTEAGVRVRRIYEFKQQGFDFVHTIELKNESTKVHNLELELTMPTFGNSMEGQKQSFLMPSANTSGAGACVVEGKRHTVRSEDVHEDPKDHRHEGSVSLATVDQHYFVASVAPATGTRLCEARPWTFNGAGDTKVKAFDVVVQYDKVRLEPGAQTSLRADAFVGPKQIDVLRSFGHGLEESVDFGMLAVLCRPMLYLLVLLKGQLGNFGFAIIALTLIIFALQFPLTHKPQIAMRQFGKKMKDLKPELDKLKEKYGHDQRTMVEQQQKFMTEKGLDPFAPMKGCLPMMISMPIWFALYRTLSMSIELYQQPFAQLGITDLTIADAILMGFPLLPLIVCGLMLVQTLMQPPPEDQPQMKYVMWGMPIFFGFLMLNMAAGLSIYMITNSLLRMAQSYWIKTKYP
jgi:YidC/Oxa1 family membrane protein insertase